LALAQLAYDLSIERFNSLELINQVWYWLFLLLLFQIMLVLLD